MASPIPVAMIGTGHAHASGKLNVLRRSKEYHVVGVCEPDEALRNKRQTEKTYKDVKWLTLAETLENPDIRLIAVESDVRDLLPYAFKAIEAGKHIHLDKPPGEDIKALDALLENAARKHLYIQMGYMWRYHTGFERVIEAVNSGWLGDVYLVRAMINSLIGPEKRKELARFPGGMMFELGCHMLDRIIAILGKPIRVTPFLRHDLPIDDALADNTLAVFEFDRALAVLGSASWQPAAHRYRHFEVIGTKGTARLGPIEPPELHVHLEKARGPYKAGPQDVPVQTPPRYVGDFEEFVQIIRDDKPPSFDPDHDRIVQRALLQACGQRI